MGRGPWKKNHIFRRKKKKHFTISWNLFLNRPRASLKHRSSNHYWRIGALDIVEIEFACLSMYNLGPRVNQNEPRMLFTWNVSYSFALASLAIPNFEPTILGVAIFILKGVTKAVRGKMTCHVQGAPTPSSFLSARTPISIPSLIDIFYKHAVAHMPAKKTTTMYNQTPLKCERFCVREINNIITALLWWQNPCGKYVGVCLLVFIAGFVGTWAGFFPK